jgi:O-antigen/teichoic acid export membrane protein
LAAAATGLCYGIPAWLLIRRTWGGSIFDANLKALKDRWRQIFAFIGYTDLTALVGTIPNQLDLIVLGYFRSPTEVGYYKLAKSISLVVRYLAKPLQTVSYPALARLTTLGDKRAFLQKVRKLLTWVGLPLGALVLLGAGFISFVLPVLVGEAYLPAVRATQLLCIGSAISLAFFWTRPVYLATGHVRQMFIIISSVTVVFALLYPFVVREWGYIGSSAWMLALQVVATSVSGSWLWIQLNAREERAT